MCHVPPAAVRARRLAAHSPPAVAAVVGAFRAAAARTPRIQLGLVAALAVLAAAAAQAQPLRPGLWENTLTMKSSDAEALASMARARADLARMSPEQRKQIRAAMGTAIELAAGEPVTAQVCLTPAQAQARPEETFPLAVCGQGEITRRGSASSFRFSCKGSTGESIEGEFTLVSDTEHRGHVSADHKPDGRVVRVELHSSSRWLKADCGDVRPRP